MVNIITFNKFKKYFDRLNEHANEVGAIYIKKFASDKSVALVSIEMVEMYRRLESLYWIERTEEALDIDCSSILRNDTDYSKLVILESVAQYIEEIPEQYRNHIYKTFKDIETEDCGFSS